VILKGWQLNAIITLTDGPTRSISDNSRENSNRMGAIGGLRANLIPGGDTNPSSGTSAGCTQGSGSTARVVPAGAKLGGPDLYYDPCQFTPTTPGFYGTLGRNTLIAPGLASVDFSLTKNFSLTENNRLQFRSEFFNALNRPNFAEPGTRPYDNQGRPDLSSGTITSTKGSARQIQFGLKFLF